MMNPRFRLAAIATFGAGAIHVIHAPTHADPLFFWFFMLTAASQFGITAGLSTGRRWAPWAALLVNGALIGIYATTRFIPPPGHLTPEPVEVLGIAAKLFEAASLAAVLLGLRAAAGSGRQTPPPHSLAVSRRQLLRASSLGAAGLVGGGLLSKVAAVGAPVHADHGGERGILDARGHFGNLSVGEVDTSRFDPLTYLREFDRGKTSRLANGKTLREFDITAVDIEIEVAPGVFFPAWAYNGRVPGPTLRATEGDLVRIRFTNAGVHPHTMHFHGFHRANMDGVFEPVGMGETFVYEFEAEPFGLHLYHCHTLPLKRHIHKGLYGVFIVDPPGGRPEMDEMVMMMNGFDTNFDGDNEIYSVNTVAFYYMQHPIVVRAGRPFRIYLVNITEFDLINSFHSHATFFDEYRTGTKLEPDNFTDTVILGQGERSILELVYRHPGDYMFHAHVSEFAELGWSGMFRVQP